MVQLEQLERMNKIEKLKEQIQAEFRKHDTLHAEFIQFDINEKHTILRVKDSMGYFTIETLKWLDDKYKAGVVFAGDFLTGEHIPYVLVE